MGTAPDTPTPTISPSTVYTDTALVNCTCTVTDPDGDNMNVTFTWKNGSTTLTTCTFNNQANGTTLTCNTTNNTLWVKGDVLNCSVDITDNTSATASNFTTITVSNSLPSITTDPGDTTVNTSVAWVYDFNATDPDVTDGVDTFVWGDNVTVFEIDSSTGLVNETIAESYRGTHLVLVRVTDGTAVDSVTFNLTVNDTTAPVTSATAVDAKGNSYTFGTKTEEAYVDVSLSCADHGAGCNTTLYCTDTANTCTPSITYSSAVRISTLGTSYIRYRSNDSDSNTETVKSSTIWLAAYSRPGGGGGVGGGAYPPGIVWNVTSGKSVSEEVEQVPTTTVPPVALIAVALFVAWFFFIRE